jgi:hypothetical protein
MGKQKTLIAIVAIALVAAGAALYYFYFRPKPPAETAVTPQESAVGEETKPEEEIKPIEVELSKSDELVRKLVKELSSRPEVARWLLTDNLIRRFVVAVDLIANGDSPRIPIDFIELKGDFKVDKAEGKEFIDPNSYQRYEKIAEIFASLDTRGTVTLYKQLRLPIQQAYRELGYPEGDFNSTLKKAIISLLETPVVEGKIYVDRDVLTYKMENPELEDLTPAQKHLLRMGPDNIRMIQAKLQDIAFKLGFLN